MPAYPSNMTIAGWENLPAVRIPIAQQILGNSRPMIYVLVGRKELDMVKDGANSLITTESIKRRLAARQPAKIKNILPRPDQKPAPKKQRAKASA